VSDQPPAARGGGITVLPAGPDALLLEVAGLDQVLALDAALREAVDRGGWPWGAVTDVVPAARTVLLQTRPGTDLAALAAAARTLALRSDARSNPDAVRLEGGLEGVCCREAVDKSHEVGMEPTSHDVGMEPASHQVVIGVRYDGTDLDEVSRLTGLSPAEVVLAHTGMPWRVAFGGFVPGFGYLVGGDPRLQVPRRGSPRATVPAGSVALAGEFTGVYPRSSPGGWQLIGTTDAVLWDPTRVPPALLTPGATVRFVDATADVDPAVETGTQP
jgi:KipI family sensor histidine kinase inhibitor